MKKEDTDNEFLSTLETMLQRNFDLSKKYLTEKNAKLEMVLKNKHMQAAREMQLGLADEEAKSNPKEPVEKGDEEPEEEEDDMLTLGSDGEEEN